MNIDWKRCRISFSLGITALVLSLGLTLLPQLPERVPIHFDWSGAPDGYAGKLVAVLLLPLVMLVTLALVPALIRRSPIGYRMPHSGQAIAKLLLAVTLLISSVQVGLLLSSVRPERYAFGAFFDIGMALFLLVAGNFSSKLEPNFWIGIRTPWALTSARNWRATHRVAGRCQVALGLLLLPVPFVFGATMWPALAALVLGTLLPFVYSYYYAFHPEE